MPPAVSQKKSGIGSVSFILATPDFFSKRVFCVERVNGFVLSASAVRRSPNERIGGKRSPAGAPTGGLRRVATKPSEWVHIL